VNIVLGFDDSPCAQSALEWIVRQRWPEGTRVVAVSAVRSPISAYSGVYAPGVPVLQEIEDELVHYHEELAQRARDALKRAGLNAEARVARGDAREVLLEAVAAEHAELLVVGSHGRTGLARLVLGSVAAHLVVHAPCTVVVVKQPERK